MDFSMFEDAVIYAALKNYCAYCESCLDNPENTEQFSFIQEDLKTAAKLQEKFKQDYLSKGGQLSWL